MRNTARETRVVQRSAAPERCGPHRRPRACGQLVRMRRPCAAPGRRPPATRGAVRERRGHRVAGRRVHVAGRCTEADDGCRRSGSAGAHRDRDVLDVLRAIGEVLRRGAAASRRAQLDAWLIGTRRASDVSSTSHRPAPSGDHVQEASAFARVPTQATRTATSSPSGRRGARSPVGQRGRARARRPSATPRPAGASDAATVGAACVPDHPVASTTSRAATTSRRRGSPMRRRLIVVHRVARPTRCGARRRAERSRSLSSTAYCRARRVPPLPDRIRHARRADEAGRERSAARRPTLRTSRPTAGRRPTRHTSTSRSTSADARALPAGPSPTTTTSWRAPPLGRSGRRIRYCPAASRWGDPAPLRSRPSAGTARRRRACGAPDRGGGTRSRRSPRCGRTRPSSTNSSRAPIERCDLACRVPRVDTRRVAGAPPRLDERQVVAHRPRCPPCR